MDANRIIDLLLQKLSLLQKENVFLQVELEMMKQREMEKENMNVRNERPAVQREEVTHVE